MRHLLYKGVGIVAAASMLVATPLYANSRQVKMKLHQQVATGRSNLIMTLQNLGEEVIALEVGLIAETTGTIEAVNWKVSEKVYETHQLIELNDGREKLVFYLVSENQEVPFAGAERVELQVAILADEKLILDQEAFYVKVIEKGYETYLCEGVKVNYSEEVFDTTNPTPEPEPGGGESGGGNGSEEGSENDDIENETPSGNEPVIDQETQKPENKPPVNFIDIENHWAKLAIIEMAEQGIIRGYEDGSFKPSATITRGEFATLLARAFNMESKSNHSPFKDVQSGKWYTEGVIALYEVGITSGRTADAFGVGSPITNEEMSTMIYRVLNVLHIELSDASSQVASFSDEKQISSYAKEAVAFLSKKGVICGNTEGNFEPKSETTRAQVAVLLKRLFDLMQIK